MTALLLAAAGVACAAPSVPGTKARAGTPPPVVVGLLETPGTFAGRMAAGARAAADEVNASGGVGGRPLSLRLIQDPNPWKTGAGLMARLSSEPGLAALIGPQDGAGAHLAAQIATRRRIPIIVLSPEESLTQAKDPWVFRAVPDDAEQAKALLRWAAGPWAKGPGRAAGARGRRAAIVVPEGREGRERSRSLAKACKALGVSVEAVIAFDAGAAGTPASADAELPKGCDFLLLWLDPGPALRWFQGPGRALGTGGILASLRLDDSEFLAAAPPQAEGLAAPLLRPGQPGAAGAAPPAAPRDVLEAAAYDAVLAVAASARLRGPGTGAVREGLAQGGPWTGRSGVFRFDSQGRREGGLAVGVLRRSGVGARFE
ncbi:MAG: amino acid ABC transporter substrate-binding protein [Elusimicrobia bacterium]|nr:amino acid ABC transporter substrate-binding protein [Elusimicrobiota bacterium]